MRKQGWRPCRNKAGFRTDHVGYGPCYLHGGRTTNHRKKAREQMAWATLAEMLEDVHLEGDDREQAVVEAVHRARRMAVAFERMAAELDLVPGLDGVYGPDHQGDGRPHVVIQQLHL